MSKLLVELSYTKRMLLTGTSVTRRTSMRLSSKVGPLEIGWRGVVSMLLLPLSTAGAVVAVAWSGTVVAVAWSGTVVAVASAGAVVAVASGAAVVAVASAGAVVAVASAGAVVAATVMAVGSVAAGVLPHAINSPTRLTIIPKRRRCNMGDSFIVLRCLSRLNGQYQR